MGLFGGKGDASGGMKPGFRDLKWGDVPEAHGGSRRARRVEVLLDRARRPHVGRRARRQDRLRVLGEPLRRGPTSRCRPTSADRILKDLDDGWGKPEQPNKFIEDFLWQNKAVGPEATTAIFSRNPNTRGATLAHPEQLHQDEEGAREGQAAGALIAPRVRAQSSVAFTTVASVAAEQPPVAGHRRGPVRHVPAIGVHAARRARPAAPARSCGSSTISPGGITVTSGGRPRDAR